MIFDIENPQAAYVIAAYTIAAAALLALLFVSLRNWYRRRNEWERLRKKSSISPS